MNLSRKTEIIESGSSSPVDHEFPMSPLIDVVFLLLVYFMVTTAFVRSEADLGIQLPGRVQQPVKLDLPDMQIIEIDGEGRAILNDRVFDEEGEQNRPELTRTLVRFREASQDLKTPAMITIQAADEAPHQAVVEILDACAAADITSVSFSLE